MIQAKNLNQCANLSEFYVEIRRQQEDAHGKDYCNHHDIIKKLLLSGMSYKELGVHQGATAACAALCMPSSIELIDISFNLFNPSKPLFESFCRQNEISLILREIDSTNSRSVTTNKPINILLVDSLHQSIHLIKELAIHSPMITDYMIFHDTAKPDDRLFKVLESFVQQNTNLWGILEKNTGGYGYVVLKRKKI